MTEKKTAPKINNKNKKAVKGKDVTPKTNRSKSMPASYYSPGKKKNGQYPND